MKDDKYLINGDLYSYQELGKAVELLNKPTVSDMNMPCLHNKECEGCDYLDVCKVKSTPLSSGVEEAIEHKMNCLDGQIDNIQGNLDSCEIGIIKSVTLQQDLNLLKMEYKFLNNIKQVLSDNQSKFNAIEEIYKLPDGVMDNEEMLKEINKIIGGTK